MADAEARQIDSGSPSGLFSGRTAWARNLAAPVRDFLTTESGGATALLVATIAALAWSNSPWPDSYESVWMTELSIRLGDSGIAMSLREWVNSGLMTFFFLVVGLEAKRELDLGALRERRRATIPFAAALGGLALRVAMLTAAVFDDLVALAVIAVAYTEHVAVTPLVVAVALFVSLFALRWAP